MQAPQLQKAPTAPPDPAPAAGAPASRRHKRPRASQSALLQPQGLLLAAPGAARGDAGAGSSDAGVDGDAGVYPPARLHPSVRFHHGAAWTEWRRRWPRRLR